MRRVKQDACTGTSGQKLGPLRPETDLKTGLAPWARPSQAGNSLGTVTNFAQPIILAYGTCALAKICRHLVGAWLYAQLAKNLPTSTIALDPYEFRSLQGVLIKRRSLISF